MRRFIQPRDRTREKHVAVNAEAPVKVTYEPCREHPDPGAFTVGTRSFPFRFRQLSDRDLYPTIHAPRQHQIRILVQIAESGPTQPQPSDTDKKQRTKRDVEIFCCIARMVLIGQLSAARESGCPGRFSPPLSPHKNNNEPRLRKNSKVHPTKITFYSRVAPPTHPIGPRGPKPIVADRISKNLMSIGGIF